MTEDRLHSESAKSRIAAVASLLVCLAATAFFLVKGLTPADLPPGSPNFVDNIFHNKGVVLAARLLLVSSAVVLAVGGIYIAASTINRMANREWLRKAGPFEIPNAAVSEVEGQLEHWHQMARAGEDEIADLTEELREAKEMIEQLQQEIDDDFFSIPKPFDFDHRYYG